MQTRLMAIFLIIFSALALFSKGAPLKALEPVLTGLDILFQDPALLKGKKIGLITNQTAINQDFVSAETLFLTKQKEIGYELTALFAPTTLNGNV